MVKAVFTVLHIFKETICSLHPVAVAVQAALRCNEVARGWKL